MESPDLSNEINGNIFQNLSKEDMDALMGMYEKIMSTPVDPDKLEQEGLEESKNQYAGLFENKEPLLDSPVELVFTVSCNVLNKNTKGEVIGTDQVLVKYYHVPLNNKKEVERYIEGFFNKFHDRMEKQADESIPPSEENNNE